MRSIYAYTEEIDDLEKAVAELKAQVEKEGPLLMHSYGIVNCDYEVDTARLAELLKAEFDFPVMGCTAISVLNVKQTDYGHGYQKSSFIRSAKLFFLSACTCSIIGVVILGEI